jgi:hypothetical protein
MGVILTFANGGVKRSAIKGRLALVRLHFGFRDIAPCTCQRMNRCTICGKLHLCEMRQALCFLTTRYAITTRQKSHH